MLKVIKHTSQYCWGSEGSYTAVVVFDTTTKQVSTILQWGGYIEKGNYYPSKYSIFYFNSFNEAVKEMAKRCAK